MKRHLPLVTLFACIFILKMNTSAQSWVALSGTALNSSVYTLLPYNGYLYVGGGFYNYPDIAKYNGTAWSGVSTGVSGSSGVNVGCFNIINSTLYVGGSFNIAGSVSAKNIAMWNGTAFSALGTGIVGMINQVEVSAICEYDGNIFAAGNFTSAGGNPVNNIAKWNGTNWSALGSGTDGNITSLCVYHGELFAGGNFNHAGGLSAINIAKWNDTSWTAIGSGANLSGVRALTVYNDEIYAGGAFNMIGGVSADGIAKWNGTSWSAVGSASGSVNCIFVYDSLLYVGKYREVNQWDGSTWSTLGSGISDNVYALAVYNNELYAAGMFQNASGNSTPFIAKWNLPVGVKEYIEKDLINIYPNPSKGIFTIIANDMFKNAGIEIYDVLGKNIHEQKIISSETEINLVNQPEGIYFLQFRNNEQIFTRKIILSK